jgi:hypothetical protein
MGDNRQATRAPGPAPDAKKKDAGADAGGGGAVPEGAAAQPGAALIALGAAHASTLLGMLQSAGGNAEVNELQSLEAGKQLAAQAKADKDNVDNMTDGQKVEKFGGTGEGSGKAPAPEGTPPEGAPAPGQVTGFHASRAGQLSQLASQHKAVGGQLAGAAGAEGLAPQMAGFLGQAGAQSLTQGASLGQLAMSYIQTSKELGKSEFVGAAMPAQSIQGDYQARAAGIQSQVAALDAMTAEYGAALAAEEGKIAGITSQIADLQKQIAEAQAAKGAKGKEGGGGPAPAPGMLGGAMSKVAGVAPMLGLGGKRAGKGTDDTKAGAQPGQPSAGGLLGGVMGALGKVAAKGETKGADGKGAEAKKDVKGADAKPPMPAPVSGGAKAPSGATAKAPAPVVAPAPAPKAPEAPAPPPTPSGAGADPVPGMMAQIQTLLQQKQAIEKAIRSNQGLVSTMKAYREQMNALLSAYQTVLNITPPKA